MRKTHLVEVWLMWKDKHNFNLHVLATIGIWLTILGIIGSIIAAANSPAYRLLLYLFAFILFVVLVISVFIASGE